MPASAVSGLRLAVSMKDDDNESLLELQSLLTRRLKRRLSLSEVVRIAIKEKLETEKRV